MLRKRLSLNQRVQGSSPCAPTNDFNNLKHILFGDPDDRNGLRTPCGPHRQSNSTREKRVAERHCLLMRNSRVAKSLAARSASSSRISTLRTARTVARMTAKFRIDRRVLRLGRLGRLFPIPILELRASIPSPSEILAVRLHASHSHFSLSLLKKRRMSRPSCPKLNNGRAFW
jgi:hypothetical protein